MKKIKLNKNLLNKIKKKDYVNNLLVEKFSLFKIKNINGNKIKIYILNISNYPIDNLLNIFNEYPEFYSYEIFDKLNDQVLYNYDLILTINFNLKSTKNKIVNLVIYNNILTYNNYNFDLTLEESEYKVLYLLEKTLSDEKININDLLSVNKKLTKNSSIYIPFKNLDIKKSNNGIDCKTPRLYYLNFLFKDFNNKIFYKLDTNYNNLDLLIIIDIPDWAFDYLVNSYKKYLTNYAVILFKFFKLITFTPKRIINYQYWTLNKYNYIDKITINMIHDFMAFNENYINTGAKESLELILNKNKKIIVSNQSIQEKILENYNFRSEILNETSNFESEQQLTNFEEYKIVNKSKITLGAIGNFDGPHKIIKKLDILESILNNYSNINFFPINSFNKKVNQDDIKKYIKEDIDLMINFSEVEGAPRSILDTIFMGKGFISRINSVGRDIEAKAKYYNLSPCIIFNKDDEFIKIIEGLNENKIKELNRDALIFSKILLTDKLIYASKIANIQLKYNKISVLMPVYNPNLIYFNRSLLSIKYQYGKNSFYNLQVVIVDDGSILDIVPFLERFNKDNGLNIKYIRLKENMGVSSALHIGLLECDNNFIIRMDYDDMMVKNRIYYQAYMFDYYEKIYNNLCILGGDMICIDSKNKFLKNYPQRPFIIDKTNHNNLNKWYLNHPSICFEKEKFLKCTNYPPFFRKNAEDLLTWIKIIESDKILINDQKPVILYRIHDKQITKDNEFKDNYKKMDINEIKKNIFFKINHKEYIKNIKII